MPTYEYRCPLGHDFEHFFRKISDAQGAQHCPECGAAGERRLSSGAGLLFKGSGFYLTDYGKNAHRAPAAGAADGGGATDGKSGEGKAGESKAGEGKPAEVKGSDATGGAAKPAAVKAEKSAPAPKSSGSAE